jgi:hypothetical protein
MSRPRATYNAPTSLTGVLGRFYPIIIPVLSFPVATEIGALRAHSDAALGHPILPYLFAPFAGVGWVAASAQTQSLAINIAATSVEWTVFVGFMTTFGLMLIDFAHGRSWGPLNIVFVVITLWSDVERSLRFIPPSHTWWGGGGMMDSAARRRSSKRKPPKP